MMWKSRVQLQLLNRTLSCDPTSLVQPCFNHVSLLAVPGSVASCLLLSLQGATEFILGRNPRKAPHALRLALLPSNQDLSTSPFVLPLLCQAVLSFLKTLFVRHEWDWGSQGTGRGAESEVPTVTKSNERKCDFRNMETDKTSVSGWVSSNRGSRKIILSLFRNPCRTFTKHISVDRNHSETRTMWVSCNTMQKSRGDLCYNSKEQITGMFHCRVCVVAAANSCPGNEDCNICIYV